MSTLGNETLSTTQELAQLLQMSVVIPTLNEERHLRNCLESLVRADFLRKHFEVVVIDNGSTDSTIQIAESFASELNIRVFVRQRVFISALRNFGVSMAKGAYVAFVDADCVVPPNWLRDGMRRVVENGAGIVGAHYRIPAGSSLLATIWDRHQIAAKVGRVNYVPGGDLMIGRAHFLSIGGFDESIETNEDAELCERARHAGLSVCSFPELAVIHYGTPQSLRAFYRKQRWHGTHVFRVFLRDFPHSENTRVVLLALFVLGCELGIAFGIVIGLARGEWRLLYVMSTLIVLPALVLSTAKVATSNAWSDFIGLALLYFTYSIARARCLLNVKT